MEEKDSKESEQESHNEESMKEEDQSNEGSPEVTEDKES